jgi:hypothetical protein
VSNVVGEPLGRAGCEHGSRMALPSGKLVGKFKTLEWMEQGAPFHRAAPSMMGGLPISATGSPSRPGRGGIGTGPC